MTDSLSLWSVFHWRPEFYEQDPFSKPFSEFWGVLTFFKAMAKVLVRMETWGSWLGGQPTHMTPWSPEGLSVILPLSPSTDPHLPGPAPSPFWALTHASSSQLCSMAICFSPLYVECEQILCLGSQSLKLVEARLKLRSSNSEPGQHSRPLRKEVFERNLLLIQIQEFRYHLAGPSEHVIGGSYILLWSR